MNKKIKILLFGTLLCILPLLAANAQDVYRHEIKAYGCLPLGKFAKNTQTEEMIENKEAASGAAFGTGIGYRYSWQFSWNLELFAGIDFFWNPCSAERKKNFSNNSNETPPQYLNIPITFGLNLISPLEENFCWYFNVGAGVNMNKTTSTGWIDHETYFKLGFSPVINASAGITIFKHYTFGFTVETLTSFEVKLKEGYTDELSIHPSNGLRRNMLIGTVHLGYTF